MESTALQDYLKAIYKIQIKDGTVILKDKFVSTKELAERMDLSFASVTNMFKKLSKNNYINYIPYQGAQLTKSGEKVAVKIIRRHRILELFLVDVLKLGWEEVDQEAEILEHVISDRILDKICELLGEVKVDPHGSPIPTKDGKFEQEYAKPLIEFDVGSKVIIKRIKDNDSEKLKYLESIGLIPKAKITLEEIAPFKGPLSLLVKGKKQVISYEFGKSILVI